MVLFRFLYLPQITTLTANIDGPCNDYVQFCVKSLRGQVISADDIGLIRPQSRWPFRRNPN